VLLIEVAYARPEAQLIIELQVESGATVEQAILRSGILQRFPEIDLSLNKVGIFGKQVPLQQPVLAGDRVEIYRGLIADPKLARRQKAGGK
jgi:putative ubiquitin-RnfH superfamily antitoxin RatB of RatAB toxin-antitoxin module